MTNNEAHKLKPGGSNAFFPEQEIESGDAREIQNEPCMVLKHLIERLRT
jgi:hypothetical protein